MKPSSPHLEAARKRAMDSLARSEQLRAGTFGFAESAAQAAVSGQEALRGQLPALGAAISTAGDDEARQAAERNYLTATANLRRLEQAFQVARRQQIGTGLK